MSNTDPDLQPKEKNLPVAIDVVNGNLIVKRHSGREEFFPLLNPIPPPHSQTLYMDLRSNGVLGAHSSGPCGTVEFAEVYDAETAVGIGDPITTTEIHDAGAGYELGDDYLLSVIGGGTSLDLQLRFRVPGLYLMTISGPGIVNTGFQATYQGPNDPQVSNLVGWCNHAPVGTTLGPVEQMIIPVRDDDTSSVAGAIYRKRWECVAFNDNSVGNEIPLSVQVRRAG